MINSPLAVLGAGSWGTALALHAARLGQTVRLWGHRVDHMQALRRDRCNKAYLPDFPFPETLTPCESLAEALVGVQDVWVVVPSFAVRHVIQAVQAVVTAPVRVVLATKGVDPDSAALLHTVIAAECGIGTPVAVISGPTFAAEVAAELPSAITLASYDAMFREDTLTRLHATHFRVYRHDDVVGVEWCGILKNILAIAVGISDGMQLGFNARSALLTRGLQEMKRFCVASGGREETIMTLAGVGDLMLTAMADRSRNRRFGLAIGQGQGVREALDTIGQAVEGFYNLPHVFTMGTQMGIHMPIVEVVYRVICENLSPHAALIAMLDRDPAAGLEF
ncbi:MAG: glycerol-3-phosphate dehydrogenase [Gammaproteobacteria bacterium RIFCSPHIGHO2_12_FULL_45_9]|nr:MAG: glycerol-3-phosphate dehydrogenase [Gammaproteobacteria bacterium RIFCSPHIGHO2_12_FULL_45_9]